jgi:DDE family transposase
VLDMDSSESPTYGEQEGSAYNGHFGCNCYHSLFVFNQLGDVERCALRSGNVHSADDWRAVLEPLIARYRGTVKHRYFRGDAAFANPEIYEFLEAEGMGYAIRLPPTGSCRTRSDTCSNARSGDRRTRCDASTPASAIRRRAGRNPVGWWPRLSGIRAGCRLTRWSCPTEIDLAMPLQPLGDIPGLIAHSRAQDIVRGIETLRGYDLPTISSTLTGVSRIVALPVRAHRYCVRGMVDKRAWRLRVWLYAGLARRIPGVWQRRSKDARVSGPPVL